MTTASIELPIPPPANNAYFNLPRGGRAPSKRHREWKKVAGWVTQIASLPKFQGDYSITISVPKSMRGDVDGRAKLAIDLFAELKVTPDDKHCQRCTVKRSVKIPTGRCLIVIEGNL
jgi:hypothetical protein